MKRAETTISLMIVALLVLFSQVQGAAAPKAHTVGKACYATIRVPADDSVYSNLAILTYNKVHMTCPLNVSDLPAPFDGDVDFGRKIDLR